MDFTSALESFRVNVEKMMNENSDKMWGEKGLSRPNTHVVTLEVGPKYVRVVRQEKRLDTGEIHARSVYCFVQKDNGDILKAASWKAPAKHARGSIFNADNLQGCGPYGVQYLR